MAFAPIQSGLYAGIQSNLFERLGVIQGLNYTWEQLLVAQHNFIERIFIPPQYYNPPGPYADPEPLMAEAEAAPWINATGGPAWYYWEKLYRTAPWSITSPIYPRVTDEDFADYSVAFQNSMRSQIIVRNTDADRILPLLPIVNGYPSQLQFFRQSCYWFEPATLTSRYTPAPTAVWISTTCTQRARYKMSWPSHGFCALAEIYALHIIGPAPGTWRFGFSNVYTERGQEDRQFDALTILNVRSLPTYPWQRESQNPNTWIEIPTEHIFMPAQGGQPGYMGNIIFSVDFETKAEWTARTGVPIIPLV